MKKHLLIICSIFVLATNLFAIPGVERTPYEEIPGEFIYFRDYSFNRESYVGFLMYDKATYAVRYFAPATETLPYKNIELLFTINPDKDYVDMTGERFVTTITPDDTEIINYMHDLVYELCARRKKAGLISPEVELNPELNPLVKYNSSSVFMDNGFVSREDYAQFGGDVFVYYDYLMPIFNIKKIVSNSGEEIFKAVAIGRLFRTDYEEFSKFFPRDMKELKITHKKAKKNPKKVVVTEGNATITFDENWQSAGNLKNFFLEGDSASIRILPIQKAAYMYYVKTALYSFSPDSYKPLSKVSCIRQKDRITFYATVYEEKNTYNEISSVIYENSLLPKDEYTTLMLTVSTGDYNANRKYYNEIVKNWK
ncbi:hypothetical protein [Treponema sp.]|uniref:hypothetical protein n=1 Tax=Treponema sp. TaxID=166 RepID=UPI00298D6AEA|nr:hypothetical protein [Treponema sp.]MCR5612753.1 hypothetical protein [Treponema sp.]